MAGVRVKRPAENDTPDAGIDAAITQLAQIEDKDVPIRATHTGIDEAIAQLANVQDRSITVTATPGRGSVRQHPVEERYAAAEEQAASFIQGDKQGGITGIGAKRLFDADEAQTQAASIAATVRAEIEAERPTVTVGVQYVVEGDLPPGINPTTSMTTPNQSGLRTDAAQNNTTRGEINASGGSVWNDDYAFSLGGVST